MADTHYNEDYFKWQKPIGEFSAKANRFFFKPYVKKDDNVLDFGCGGAFYLADLECKGRMGIEINDTARNYANTTGINVVKETESVPDNWADILISCHCLEHCPNPLIELQKLKPKLKKGARIIFVLPYERKMKYKQGDINQHFYTWSEMNLGNMFTLAGFRVDKVEEIKHKWPPAGRFIMKNFGEKAFYLLSRLWGSIKRYDTSQIRIFATNP